MIFQIELSELFIRLRLLGSDVGIKFSLVSAKIRLSFDEIKAP